MARNTMLMSQLWDYSKFLLASVLIWTTGYWGLSVAWIGIATLFIYIWMFERPDMLRSFNRKQVKYEVDHNSAWLSKVFAQLWPYANKRFEEFMRTQLQLNVKKYLPSTLSSFSFTSIVLGDQVPQVLAVEVKQGDPKYVILDIEIVYSSDAAVGFSIGKLESLIKDVQVHGTLRVVLTELNSTWPFFGKMNLSFVSSPEIDFRLAKIASFLDVVGFRFYSLLRDHILLPTTEALDLGDTSIEDCATLYANHRIDIIHDSVVTQMSELLVLPHFLTIPVNTNYAHSASYPLPQGVLRVRVNSAKNLYKPEDKERIDPYCVLQVGATRYKTDVIQKTTHPLWNDVFDFLVFDVDCQYLEIQCIDSSETKDTGSLGSCYLNIKTILSSTGNSCSLTLDGNNGDGMVSITTTWLMLAEQYSHLPVPGMVHNKWKSTSVVSLGVQSATNLPPATISVPMKGLKSIAQPSSYVRVTIGSTSYQTTVKHLASDPEWGEHFLYLLHNPVQQDIQIEVLDSMTNTVIAKAYIPTNILLEDMNISGKRFPLTKTSAGHKAESETDCYLTLSLITRVLVDAGGELLDPRAEGEPRATVSTDVSITTGSFPVVSTPTRVVPKIQLTGVVSSPILDEARSSPLLGAMTEAETVSAGGHSDGGSDLLDFDSWSEPGGGSTYMVISRPDGNTVSEIVQNADENTTANTEKLLDDSFGKIQVTLRYSTTHQKMIIAVHRCVNLKPEGQKEGAVTPDPFVVITLYNGKTKIDRKKTKHQKATLSPVFDETFEFKLAQPLVDQAVVEMRIKNKKSIFQKGRSNMGSVVLNVGSLDLTEARTEWFLIRTVHASMESLNDTTLNMKSQQ